MKKQLLSALAIAFATASFAQSKMTSTGYADLFEDGVVAASAEDGWYSDATIYPSITEEGGKLVISAENADMKFKGFGLYLQPTTKIDVTASKTVKMDVTNNGDVDIVLRVDLKVVDPNFGTTNCPVSLGDTVNANFDVANKITIPAGTTKSLDIDYTGATYEYDEDCSDDAWTPAYYEIQDWTDAVGLYIVINGGAGESWCNGVGCDPFTGTIAIDNLVIGTRPINVDGILNSANISSISVSPNPASDFTTLNYNATAETVVNVADLKGNVVKSLKGSTTSATINTSDLTPGLYVVTVLVDGVPSAVEKLVVK